MFIERRWLAKGRIDETGRDCARCGEYKVWNQYDERAAGINGHNSWCCKCVRDYSRMRAQEKYGHVPRVAKEPKLRRVLKDVGPQGEKNRRNALEQHYRRRELVFEHYGRMCVLCGEDDEGELQIDHVNNDGKQHREEDVIARNLTYWVVRNGFPPGFQILCRHCNLRKALAFKQASISTNELPGN